MRFALVSAAVDNMLTADVSASRWSSPPPRCWLLLFCFQLHFIFFSLINCGQTVCFHSRRFILPAFGLKFAPLRTTFSVCFHMAEKNHEKRSLVLWPRPLRGSQSPRRGSQTCHFSFESSLVLWIYRTPRSIDSPRVEKEMIDFSMVEGARQSNHSHSYTRRKLHRSFGVQNLSKRRSG